MPTRKKRKKSHTPRITNKSINAHLQSSVEQHPIDSTSANNCTWANTRELQKALATSQWRKAVMTQGIDQVISKRPELDLSNYKNLPCIDLRNICKESVMSNEDSLISHIEHEWAIPDKDLDRLSSWIDSHYWLAMVPCFSEGVYRTSNTSYIRWSLDHMDIERNLIQIKIDYFDIDECEKPWLQCHIESSIIFGSDDDAITILTNEKKNATATDVIASLNPYTVKQWNTADIAQWKYMVQNVRKTVELAKAQGQSIADTKTYHKLTKNLLIYTSIVNAAMADSQYAAKEAPSPSLNEDTAISSRPDKYEPTIKTFKIGRIVVNSYIGSPEPIEWTNVEYRTPSWMVRGHIRRLKSGKTCFVHSHEKRRRKVPVDDCPVPAASPNICITGGNNKC